METESVIDILEGTLQDARKDLEDAETEVEIARREVDFYETMLDLARQEAHDEDADLVETERDQVVSWVKRNPNGKGITTTLGEVRSVEEYDALVAKQRRRDRAAKEGPCDRCSVVHGEHTGGDHSFKAQEGTVKAPESPAEGLEPFFPTPTKGKARRRDRGCFS